MGLEPLWRAGTGGLKLLDEVLAEYTNSSNEIFRNENSCSYHRSLYVPPAISYAAQETGSRIYVVSGNVYVLQGKNPAHRVTNSEPIVSDTITNTSEKALHC